MNKEILSKDVTIEDNLVVITENTKTTMGRNQLESQLREISSRKSRLQEQNTRIIAEYKKLSEEETEINNLINQLVDGESLEMI